MTQYLETGVAVGEQLPAREQLRQFGELLADVTAELTVVVSAIVDDLITRPAAGVLEEVAHRDRGRRILVQQTQIGQVPAHRCVDLQQPLFDQPPGGGRGIGLADRGDLEPGLRGHRPQ